MVACYIYGDVDDGGGDDGNRMCLTACKTPSLVGKGLEDQMEWIPLLLSFDMRFMWC